MKTDFPQTYEVINGFNLSSNNIIIQYFSISLFGVLTGEFTEPNIVLLDGGIGARAVIKDPRKWTPFNLFAPILWIYGNPKSFIRVSV